MQVKKFEAPTLQEALENIKRELGPEAIILQTKKYKRGFGLMSRASVEVTAAVSERSLVRKGYLEARLPDESKEAVKKLPANRQAELYDRYSPERKLAKADESAVDRVLDRRADSTQDRVEIKARPAAGAARRTPAIPAAAPTASAVAGETPVLSAPVIAKKITQTRYADITDDGAPRNPAGASAYGVNGNGLGRAAGDPMSAELKTEFSQLKRLVNEIKSIQDSSAALGAGAQAFHAPGPLGNVALQDSFEQLVINGVDKRYALALLKKVGFELGEQRSKHAEAVLDQLAYEIMQTVELSTPLAGIKPNQESGPAVIALVGPTGVGKTTTLAKIASQAIHSRNLKVGMINVDNAKVTAFDQIATYAKILNVPFRSALSVEDLGSAIQDFKNLDLVLVDTTGRSQRDPTSLQEIQTMLKSIPQMQTQLVLSATTRDADLYDMASRFSIFRPQGIIFSKLDEATVFGAVYNVPHRVKLPLLYFTTGQRVPQDIEEATRERVVALLMDI